MSQQVIIKHTQTIKIKLNAHRPTLNAMPEYGKAHMSQAIYDEAVKNGFNGTQDEFYQQLAYGATYASTNW